METVYVDLEDLSKEELIEIILELQDEKENTIKFIEELNIKMKKMLENTHTIKNELFIVDEYVEGEEDDEQE